MTNLDLESVRAFVLIAELRSFTRAAEVLGSTQSALSVKLKRLEQRLGKRLLQRTPRHLRLSAEGAAFLPAARDLIAAHERAVQSLQKPQRRLVIGVSQMLAAADLPLLLQQLLARDPSLLIELRVLGSNTILQQFDQGALDAGIVLHTGNRRPQGELLCHENVSWFATPEWRQRAVSCLPLATQGEGCAIRAMATAALNVAGITWREAFIGHGGAALGAAASSGLVIAVMATSAAPPETVDVTQALQLPALAPVEVALYSAIHDVAERAAIEPLTQWFRGRQFAV